MERCDVFTDIWQFKLFNIGVGHNIGFGLSGDNLKALGKLHGEGILHILSNQVNDPLLRKNDVKHSMPGWSYYVVKYREVF